MLERTRVIFSVSMQPIGDPASDDFVFHDPTWFVVLAALTFSSPPPPLVRTEISPKRWITRFERKYSRDPNFMLKN